MESAGAMTAAQNHISCPSCGAGLDILGGGRTRVQVCSYCGATLDANGDYTIMLDAAAMQRPETPFQLGMVGDVFGQSFTVIGIIAWFEEHDGRTYTWVDHQIYSPTHGYAWLTYEDGWITFTRKTRVPPNPATLTGVQIETSENRPKLRWEGRTFTYYSSGRIQPSFIEGAFNYVPRITDTSFYVDLLCEDRMLTLSSAADEQEYELTELPDQAALIESFQLPADGWHRADPEGTHVLKPYKIPKTASFLRNVLMLAAVACLGMWMMTGAFTTTLVPYDEVRYSGPVSVPFTVTETRGLTEIMLRANVDNSWAAFETELLNEDDETIAEYAEQVAHYSGTENGEYWSEGRTTAFTRLILAPGDYTLVISLDETGVDWPGGEPANAIGYKVVGGVWSTVALKWASLLFGGLVIAFLARRYFAHQTRMAGSDWSDD
jgi:hypothetical protein